MKRRFLSKNQRKASNLHKVDKLLCTANYKGNEVQLTCQPYRPSIRQPNNERRNVATSFSETAKLLASDGATNDQFGRSVAIDKDTIVVGSWLDDDNATNSGSAYVYERQGNLWIQTAKLLPSDEGFLLNFGISVAIDKETIVVGAYGDDDNGTQSGSAYVFEKQGNLWVETAKLLASDGATFDFFGRSVAIDKNTIVVGARGDDDNGTQSGSAYIFERQDTLGGSLWVETAKLIALDNTEGDFFGSHVAISGKTIVAGAYRDDDNGTNSGSVYVFEKHNSLWIETAKLLASDGAEGDFFGISVTIDKNTIVIGAYFDDDNGSASGSAYVFEKYGNLWIETAKLTTLDAAEADLFGVNVAVDKNTIVVGAYGDDDNGTDSGSAYIYEKHGNLWIQTSKLIASDGIGSQFFGFSVAISGKTIVVGAYRDDDNGSASGSAYVYSK